MYDGPWARIIFADKSHARFRLQRGIEPCYGVRAATFYFDLNDLSHASPAVKMPCQLNKSYLIVAGDLDLR